MVVLSLAGESRVLLMESSGGCFYLGSFLIPMASPNSQPSPYTLAFHPIHPSHNASCRYGSALVPTCFRSNRGHCPDCLLPDTWKIAFLNSASQKDTRSLRLSHALWVVSFVICLIVNAASFADTDAVVSTLGLPLPRPAFLHVLENLILANL